MFFFWLWLAGSGGHGVVMNGHPFIGAFVVVLFALVWLSPSDGADEVADGQAEDPIADQIQESADVDGERPPKMGMIAR